MSNNQPPADNDSMIKAAPSDTPPDRPDTTFTIHPPSRAGSTTSNQRPTPPRQERGTSPPSTTWPTQKDENGHNNWTKKIKVNSAKCSICGERMFSYTWECDFCRKRICPECAEPQAGSSSAVHKYIAQNNLTGRCSCAYPSGQAPNLRKEMIRLGIFAKSTHMGTKVTSKVRKLLPPAVPCAHLQGGGTVIVGAGVIGLSIALELAKKAKATATWHHITVVDIRGENADDAASSRCGGVLKAESLSLKLENLKTLAQQGWSEHMRTPGLHSEINLVTNNVFSVQRYKGGGHESVPSWYPASKYDAFESLEDAMGTIDTNAFTAWLRGQCRAHEVELLWGHDVAEIRGSAISDISAVIVQQLESENDGIECIEIGCQNLLLAAGPWTTDIFYDLFEGTSLQLHNRVRNVHHLRSTRSNTSRQDKKALIFPDLAADEDALEDGVTIVAHKYHDLMAYAADSTVEDDRLPSSATRTKTASPEAAATLRTLVAKRLSFSPDSLASAVSAPISTASADGLPLIAKIPCSQLTGSRGKHGDEDQRPTGVWLCYGFGMHGTTLAPGVAKGLARWMFGELDGNAYIGLGVDQ